MVKGIYTAASGMLTAQRDINVRSNNLANLSTAGFKSDTLVTMTFAEALAFRQQPRITGAHVPLTGAEQPREAAWRYRADEDADFFDDEIEGAMQRIRLSRGLTALETMTDFTQGSLQLTERALDFAIAGDGFFIIESRRGEYDEYDNPFGVHGGVYYTRNGQFQLNEEGYLMNGRGDFVLDDGLGQIWIGTDDFYVNEFGAIFVEVNPGQFEHFATIGVFVPDNPHLLFKNGEDIFTILNEDFEPEALEFTGSIRQRYIERSNTDVASEMAGMMLSSRQFQSMSQIIRTIDALLARSISEVGNTR